MAEVLSKQPRPKGPRLVILTNAGGPGVLATDALIENQGELAPLSAETMAALDAILPAAWSHSNPIDILGDADPERYASSLEITAKDPNIDGLLAILTPQAMTNPTATAEHLRQHARISGKPVLASWMGGEAVEAGEQILNQAGIPTYEYPDAAAHVFTLMWRSSYNLQGLYETPSLPVDSEMATSCASVQRRSSPRSGARAGPCSPSSNRSNCWPPTGSPRSKPRLPRPLTQQWPPPRTSATRSC